MSALLFGNMWTAAVLAVLLTSSTVTQANDVTQVDDGGKVSRHEVKKTYNNSPFAYNMRLVRKTDAYGVYRLTYPSPVVTEHEKNGDTRDPLVFAEQKYLLKLQMAGGLVAGISLSPSLLNNLATFSEVARDDIYRIFSSFFNFAMEMVQ